jgi:hypothetical protein
MTKRNQNESAVESVESEEAVVVEQTESAKPLTPYGAAKLVNAALEEAGVDKVIPPQMMYNYTMGRLNKGKEPFIGFEPTKGVDRESLAEWIEKYVAKQVAKVEAEAERLREAAVESEAEVDEDQLEFDFEASESEVQETEEV